MLLTKIKVENRKLKDCSPILKYYVACMKTWEIDKRLQLDLRYQIFNGNAYISWSDYIMLY